MFKFFETNALCRRTGSRRATKAIAAAGSGIVPDIAHRVTEGGKGPARGRRFLPAIPPAPTPEREEGAMRVSLNCFALLSVFLSLLVIHFDLQVCR
jgi:hypothetical protein